MIRRQLHFAFVTELRVCNMAGAGPPIDWNFNFYCWFVLLVLFSFAVQLTAYVNTCLEVQQGCVVCNWNVC